MIPAAFYQTLYLILVTILTVVFYAQYKNRNGLEDSNFSQTDIGGGLLVLFLILFIGPRPVSARYFTDSANYVRYYEVFYEGEPFHFNWNTENLLFDNLLAWWGSEWLGYISFFVFI